MPRTYVPDSRPRGTVRIGVRGEGGGAVGGAGDRGLQRLGCRERVSADRTAPAPVAQRIEQQPSNLSVVGSSPTGGAVPCLLAPRLSSSSMTSGRHGLQLVVSVLNVATPSRPVLA